MICLHGRVPAPSTSRPAPSRRAPLALALALALLLLPALLGSATSSAAPGAAACSCSRGGTATAAAIEARARTATDVFTGVVTGLTVRRGGAGQPSLVTHEVTVNLVYKGEVPATSVAVVTETSTGDTCGLGRLRRGVRYVFMVRDIEGSFEATGCGGTAPARASLVSAVEKLYPNPSAPQPDAEPMAAEFAPVPEVEEPTRLSRALAPGAALVVAGLLGLAVVGRRGRRSS